METDEIPRAMPDSQDELARRGDVKGSPGSPRFLKFVATIIGHLIPRAEN